MRHIKYPKTKSFKDFVHMARKGDYLGKTVFQFRGTVKIHGTNASVVYDPETQELYAQSRNNVITIDKDNAGFATYVERNKQVFLDYLKPLATSNPIVLYGEWAGKGLGKGTAMNKLEDKKFFTFDVFEAEYDAFQDSHNLSRLTKELLHSPENDLYSIEYFTTAYIDINVNSPNLTEVVSFLNELVLKVEKECPVAMHFGVEGNGEGIVFDSELPLGDVARFKVVSSKFSSHKSEPKVPVNIDTVEKKAIDELVNYVLTDARFNQAIVETKFETMSQFGSLIKWVTKDILDEEKEAVANSEIPWKQIARAITTELKKKVESL